VEFRTTIDINQNKLVKLSHRDRLLLLGSCFTDNIGERLTNGGFDCTVNPYGALYNPMSIIHALKKNNQDFIQWTQKSFDPALFVEFIEASNVFFLTFGTAWVYQLKDSGTIVANCKKMPEKMFERRRLTVNEIIEAYRDFIEYEVKRKNKRIIFTVSPIRHKKDGLHENQLSKSILLLAIDQLCKNYDDCCFYFPSYELMMDELRDYRFYAEDMLHPSTVAVRYIWEQFQQAFFDLSTIDAVRKFEKLNQILQHRPFDSENEQYEKLVLQTKTNIDNLKHAVQNQ